MFQAGTFKTVLNLSEWLPPQGETRTSLRFDDPELLLDIHYEDEATSAEKMRTIVFTGVCSFYTAALPGVTLLAVQYGKIAVSGNVVEFENSEAASAWSNHFKYRRVRHYQVYLPSENRRVEVFAGACHLRG